MKRVSVTVISKERGELPLGGVKVGGIALVTFGIMGTERGGDDTVIKPIALHHGDRLEISVEEEQPARCQKTYGYYDYPCGKLENHEGDCGAY